MQIEKLVVAAVGEGKRPTSYKEIFAAVIPAVEEEQQRQATVSSSAAACSKAAGGGVTLLGGKGCSTDEQAQLDKQRTVRVSCKDTKNGLSDADSAKPVFVGTSPDKDDCTKSAGNSESAVSAPPVSQTLPYLSKVTAACHSDYESIICCMYLIVPTNCNISPSRARVT